MIIIIINSYLYKILVFPASKKVEISSSKLSVLNPLRSFVGILPIVDIIGNILVAPIFFQQFPQNSLVQVHKNVYFVAPFDLNVSFQQVNFLFQLVFSDFVLGFILGLFFDEGFFHEKLSFYNQFLLSSF